jgi:Leucine-rich repeat (LRR) protein
LKQLRFLDLRANRLSALPESLAELHRLEKLDLRWNQFQTVPFWIDTLKDRGCIVYL